MLLDKLVTPFAFISFLITKNKEKRLGYRLRLNNPSKEWLQGEMVIEMDSVWQREGLEAIGTNYFTIGATRDGISTRFDPCSSYYQAWLGGYIVKFSISRDWTINDHFKLTIADQKNWLRIYGNNNPFVEIDKSSVEDLGEIDIDGFKGKLYQGNIISDSDVGDRRISIYNHALLAGMAYYMNRSNPELKLTSESLIPKWSNKEILKPYQRITLKGYIAVVRLPNGARAVLYVNVADYTDLKANKHENFKNLQQNLLQTIKNVDILSIN